MFDSIVTKLDMEMTEARTEEKLAQEEYEKLMAAEERIRQHHAERKWIIQDFNVHEEVRTGRDRYR